MPYITKELRETVLEVGPTGSGELNYVLTSVVKDYVNTHGLCYNSINDVLGALEGAKLEFYRRVAVPYENSKLALNGDVYSKEGE